MERDSFRAFVVRESETGGFTRAVETRRIDDLPDHDVLIRVEYSALNYKDALSASGNRGVTRAYPHTPGVEAAGTVVESRDPAFSPGDTVVAGGYDLGMNTPGGYGEYIRVPAGWIMPLPEGVGPREAMAWGAAGFTAALSVDRLQRYGVHPDSGEVLVTGATGGVGSFAVAILAKAGYTVIAATGKEDARDYLASLGAARVVGRRHVTDTTGLTLRKEKWAGAVDTVGGPVLATVLKCLRYGGVVTACGNVAGGDLATTVYPFILRGVSLVGIDSARCPMEERRRIWDRITGEWRLDEAVLESMMEEVGLDGLGEKIDRILRGGVRGRVVVKLEP